MAASLVVGVDEERPDVSVYDVTDSKANDLAVLFSNPTAPVILDE